MSDRMVLTSDWPVISQIACTMKLASLQNQYTLFSLVNVMAEAVRDEITYCCVPAEASEGGQYTRLV